MHEYAIFFMFQGNRIRLAVVNSDYKELDVILDIFKSEKSVTVGHMTSKALETPNGGFIYNFRCNWKLGLLDNAAGVSKLLRSIQTNEAVAANTKVRSYLQVDELKPTL